MIENNTNPIIDILSVDCNVNISGISIDSFSKVTVEFMYNDIN